MGNNIPSLSRNICLPSTTSSAVGHSSAANVTSHALRNCSLRCAHRFLSLSRSPMWNVETKKVHETFTVQRAPHLGRDSLLDREAEEGLLIRRKTDALGRDTTLGCSNLFCSFKSLFEGPVQHLGLLSRLCCLRVQARPQFLVGSGLGGNAHSGVTTRFKPSSGIQKLPNFVQWTHAKEHSPPLPDPLHNALSFSASAQGPLLPRSALRARRSARSPPAQIVRSCCSRS
jgi:hypothetical protein